jgi:hypothetical protein
VCCHGPAVPACVKVDDSSFRLRCEEAFGVRVSEIMGSRDRGGEVRRVGVEFPPEQRHRVMSAAIDLYRHLGLDVEVEGERIYVYTGEAMATPVMGLFERRTGRPGFNEWWSTGPA